MGIIIIRNIVLYGSSITADLIYIHHFSRNTLFILPIYQWLHLRHERTVRDNEEISMIHQIVKTIIVGKIEEMSIINRFKLRSIFLHT